MRSPCIFGRPGTPTDQARIETFRGRLKAEYVHLLKIAQPAVVREELGHLQGHWNTVRLHAAIGYVNPDDEHTPAAASRSARTAKPAWNEAVRPALPTIGRPGSMITSNTPTPRGC